MPQEHKGDRRNRARRLAPDLALAMAAIVWFYCLFVFDGRRQLFRDSDTGWHIRTGERIAMTRQLPVADPYSFTVRGKPWFAWEWLSDAAMGWTHARSGLNGVAILFVTTIALTVWLWVRFSRAAGGDFLLSCALLPLFLTASSVHWLARPHLFSWPLLVGAVWAAERVRETPGALFYGLALACGAVWANVHASFVIAPLIGLMYAAGLVAAAWLWPSESDGRRRRARAIALATGLFLLGTLANPYGWELHRHVANYLSDGELLRRVAEFQSFNFHAEGAGQITAVMVISFLGAAAALGDRQVGRALVMLCLLVIALRSARGIPIVALICLPLANSSVRSLVNRGVLREAGWVRGAAEYSANLQALDRSVSGVVWAPVLLLAGCALLAAPGIAKPAGFPPEDFPVACAGKVGELPAEARILSTDKFGGYLIYRFEGKRPVFFDGRSDLYGSAFMKRYLQLVEVRPGWERIVDEVEATHALLPADAPLRHALQKDGWRALYSDEVAFLLEKPRT